MKKFATGLMIALMALVTFTSCEDESIAATLEGTWEGKVFDYSEWDGNRYDINYSLLDFRMDPFATRTGWGYWVDMYVNGSRGHVSYKIDWKVRDGLITIKFREDNTEYCIEHYRLTDNSFSGTMYEYKNGNPVGKSHDFSMRHTSSPNWDYYYNDYDSYWGSYGGYYDGHVYYRSNDATFETEDGSAVAPAQDYSTTTVPMAPKRHLIVDEQND